MEKKTLALPYNMDMGYIETSAKKQSPWCCFLVGGGNEAEQLI